MEGSLTSSTGRPRSSQQLGSKNQPRQRQIGSKKPSADGDNRIGDKWTDDWMYVYTPDQVFLDQHLTPSEREFKGKNEDMKNFMRAVFFGDTSKRYVKEEKPPDSMGEYERWFVPRGQTIIQETGKPTIIKSSPSFELTQSQNPDPPETKGWWDSFFG